MLYTHVYSGLMTIKVMLKVLVNKAVIIQLLDIYLPMHTARPSESSGICTMYPWLSISRASSFKAPCSVQVSGKVYLLPKYFIFASQYLATFLAASCIENSSTGNISDRH